jgi:tetratricopeptide (TPR) repeat protein
MTDPAARETPIDTAIRLHGDALAALEAGELASAAGLAGQSLDLFERESGPTHPDVANVLNCLADVHEQRADYAAAERCSRRSVAIMRGLRDAGLASGTDIHRLFAQSLSKHGAIVRILGRYGEAEALLREAVSIATASLDEDDPDVVGALNGLAVLYKYTGRFDEADELYGRALRLAERNGPDDPVVPTLLHNIGGLNHARGEFARGEAAARRGVSLRERTLGPDHPAVAADVAALAALVEAQGRCDEAEGMYRRALAVFERVHGPDHYEIAVNLNNLAAVREAKGDRREAEGLYRRALSIKESLFGPDHPDVAMTLNNLALLLAETGRRAEAEPLYARSLRIFTASLDPGHPKIRTCVDNYAALLREGGRGAAARALEARYRR